LERADPDQRLAVLRSLLRVTRPGGHVLLGGPNRRFPLDLSDGRRPDRARLHAPWNRSLLSYGDQARMARATGLAASVRPLAVRGLVDWDDPHPARSSLVQAALAWLLGDLPPSIYGSWLCFFTLALVRRDATGGAATAGGMSHGVA
jgi:hypothetical protein